MSSAPNLTSSAARLTREFPKRKHRGESETPYGRALEINSLEALARFLQFFDTPAGSEREG